MDKYSSYKDSGVQWIGQIPSHWEVKHLRNFLTIFSEKGFDNAQLLSVTREKGVILRDRDDKEENHNYVPDDLSGYKHLMSGDFVINKMKSWQGSYGVSKYEGIVSPAYFTCKLRGVDPQFFSQAIRSKAYIGFFMQYSKGIRVDQWDLDPSSMKDIPFILPPLDEQKKIVPYLDAATAKIDEVIAQQQCMIDLLNERRQIIINRVITKGLNANVKMKGSGIEWVGDVPESWEKHRIYYTIERRFDGTWGDDEKGNSNDVICYRVADFNYQKGCLDNKKLTLRNVDQETREKKKVQKDYLLIEKSGGGDLYPVGRVVSVNYEQDAICSNFIHALKIKDGFDSRFIFYILKSMYANKVNTPFFNQTTGIQNLQVKEYLKNEMFYPEYKEQCRISKHLDRISDSIQERIEDCNRMISLLQERKQIIINDVVTGKVKVF